MWHEFSFFCIARAHCNWHCNWGMNIRFLQDLPHQWDKWSPDFPYLTTPQLANPAILFAHFVNAHREGSPPLSKGFSWGFPSYLYSTLCIDPTCQLPAATTLNIPNCRWPVCPQSLLRLDLRNFLAIFIPSSSFAFAFEQINTFNTWTHTSPADKYFDQTLWFDFRSSRSAGPCMVCDRVWITRHQSS